MWFPLIWMTRFAAAPTNSTSNAEQHQAIKPRTGSTQNAKCGSATGNTARNRVTNGRWSILDCRFLVPQLGWRLSNAKTGRGEFLGEIFGLRAELGEWEILQFA